MDSEREKSDLSEIDKYNTSRFPGTASGVPCPYHLDRPKKDPLDREPPVKFPLNKLQVGLLGIQGSKGHRASKFYTRAAEGVPMLDPKFRVSTVFQKN